MSETKYGALQEDIDEYDIEEAEDQRLPQTKEARVARCDVTPDWIHNCNCPKCRCKKSKQ